MDFCVGTGGSGDCQNPNALVFASARGTPLRESNVLSEALHPALEALKMPQAGMRAFCRGCNRRWEIDGVNPAVLRQQMATVRTQ